MPERSGGGPGAATGPLGDEAGAAHVPAGGEPDGPGPRRRSFIEQARRTQIVEAAIATIADVGYASATFARIARRAGISPGLISYHFAGKDELINQVVLDVEAAMERAITAETEHVESYGEAIRRIVETQVRYFGAHTSQVLALGEIFSHARAGTPVASTLAESRARALRDLEGLVREGQEQGELGDVDPRVLAITLLAALEAAPTELLSRPGADVEAYARDLASIFERATRRHQP